MVPSSVLGPVVVLICLPAVAVALQSRPDPLPSPKARVIEPWTAEERRNVSKMLADPAARREAIQIAELALGAMGYGVGPFDGLIDPGLESALRRYQARRLLPSTGQLDPDTLKVLMADYDDWQGILPRVELPSLHVYVDAWDTGYVSGKGTWTIVGQEHALPVQTSKITCRRELGTCVEITARLGIGEMLLVDSTEYQVDRWDRHEITTKPDETATCARYTLRFGRAAKAVTGRRVRISASKECRDLEPEMEMRLVSGFEVNKELIRKRHSTISEFAEWWNRE